jgi:hypothetical protein
MRSTTFGRAGGALIDQDDNRPAGETTTVPPSESGAAAALKPDEILMSVKVDSSPSDAFVEVDGYPAGRTPPNLKLAKGEYTLKVFKPGFRFGRRRLSLTPGKAPNPGRRPRGSGKMSTESL